MKVLLTGGGTGGHVCPALAIAEALQRANHEVVFAGTRHGLEARAVPAAGYPIIFVPSYPVARRVSPGALVAAAVNAAGVVMASRLLLRERPHAVANTGGYAGAALGLAAALFRIPTLLFEPNAIPGRTNLLLSRWATRIAIAYSECAPHFGPRAQERIVLTGTPIRASIGAGDKEAARRSFGLAPNRPTLLVVGGSAGARSLNDAVVAAAPALLASGAQILHQTGRAHFDQVCAATTHLRGTAAPGKQGESKVLSYVAVGYLEDMGGAYAAADVILCRAGASTIAEVTTCGLPAVLVPYPYAIGDHQTYNALALVHAGAARMIPDRELTPDKLVEAVLSYLRDPEARQRASAASRSLARPDAAANVVRILEEIGACMIQSKP